MKVDIESGIITIDNEHILKPLMTVEEIRGSNLVELMDEESKETLMEDPTYPIFMECNIDGEEISIKLDISKEKLRGVYIKVDPTEISRSYQNDDMDTFNEIVNKNAAFMREIFKGNTNRLYNFKWGYAEFNPGYRTYNVNIQIEYYSQELMDGFESKFK